MKLGDSTQLANDSDSVETLSPLVHFFAHVNLKNYCKFTLI